MGRVKGYPKFIACLETSFWSFNAEDRLSVSPILELLAKRDGTRFVYFSCSTVDELRFNLNIAKQIKGGILYLAFHGNPGKIHLPEFDLDIESLAYLMGKNFKNWIVLFDGCSTLKIGKERIRNFVSETGVAMVVGFTERVDWLEGAATDLLFLSSIQFFSNLRRFWSRFQRAYKDLIWLTGMKAYLK